MSAWHLYWVETEDHDEDWFVIARSPDEASAFFMDVEGYEPDLGDETTCELIAELPARFQSRAGPGWPTDEAIEACGGAITLQGEALRVVQIGDRTFHEGLLEHVIRSTENGRKPLKA